MSVDNLEDILDSRDILERRKELATRMFFDIEPLTGAESEELDELESLIAQGELLEDWEYGVTLIRDSYFEDYAREYAEEIFDRDKSLSWPFTHIDWEAAAADLQTDYTDIDFDGVTYWAR